MPLLLDAASSLISILINTVVLWIVLKLFKIAKNKWLTALKAAAVVGVINFVLGRGFALLTVTAVTSGAGLNTLVGLGVLMFLVSLVIVLAANTFVVKKFYNQETKKALMIAIAWLILESILGFIIGGLILGIAFAAS